MKLLVIEKGFIQTMDKVDTWKDAIQIAAAPLVKKKYIKESYIDAMIQTVLDLGSYIVIAPYVAMPHARSDGRVLKNAISILKLKEPIYFDEQEDSKALFIMPLACVDNNHHLTMLSCIADILGDVEKMNQILETNDKQQLYEIFKNITFEEES